MLLSLGHISPKTRILFAAILLILTPSAFLSYFGLESIDQKAENLRTNYQASISLLRDKIEHEIVRVEEQLRNSLFNFPAGPVLPADLKQWLQSVVHANPALRFPFLVEAGGGILSTRITSGWKKESVTRLQSATRKIDFEKAEEAEFVRRDFRDALGFYEIALTGASVSSERTFILTRIGRCYFKLGQYREGIEEYKKILRLRKDESPIGGVPASVIARLQIADGYEALGAAADHRQALFGLYAELLNSPWDLDGGHFVYYLNSVSARLSDHHNHENDQSADRHLEELQESEQELQDQIRFLNLIRVDLLPVIESDLKRGSLADLQPRHASLKDAAAVREVGYVKLPESSQQKRIMALGYELEKEFLLGDLLPAVLGSVNLGSDVAVGIVNERDSVLYLQDQLSLSKYLVAEGFTESFATWKVALFDRTGKSIGEQMAREKQLYLLLFLGIIGVMVIGIVVTARAAHHEMEAARMKADFVANVSHELKTPLALIRMFGETLEAGIVADEAKRKEFYSIIRKESERLSHLIDNVLDFSKVAAGTKEYQFEEADLVEVVCSTLEAYKFHIRDQGFEVESVLPEQPIVTSMDKDAIAQALLNLLSNATKYSGQQKFIRIEIEKKSHTAQVTVADRGVGIPKNELTKIFEKFYRASTTKTSETRGTGLGLTLVKHIIEAHKGSIQVESEVGNGTRFTMRIPLEPSKGSQRVSHDLRKV